MTRTNDDVDPAVVAELDALQARARAAVERKDLAAYIGLFSPDLRYRRADGEVIDREALLRDAQEQFRRFDRVRITSTRTGLSTSGGRAEELFTQSIVLGATVFLVVHRSATYTRNVRCVWREAEGRRLIDEFDVLDERVEPGPFRFGFRPPSHD